MASCSPLSTAHPPAQDARAKETKEWIEISNKYITIPLRLPLALGGGRRKTRLPTTATSATLANCATCFAKICKFLAGSFSAVSKRNFVDEILQENMRSTAFLKLYKICILLHRCKFKNFAKNRFEKSAILWKFSKNFANVAKFAKFCQISKKSAW